MAYNEIQTQTWSNTSKNSGEGINEEFSRIYDNFSAIVGNGGTAPDRDLSQLHLDLASIEGMALSPKARMVQAAGGLWGEVFYNGIDEIVIRPKGAMGHDPFVGIMLNDGTFIDSTDMFTIKLDDPSNSGHILDGITARLTDAWYLLWAYKDASDQLAFGFTWMAKTTISNSSAPTTTLTLNQINSQDPGYLFSENAPVVVWESSSKFETPIYDTTNGYNAAADCAVQGRISSVLTLQSPLKINNFSAGTTVYQTDNFKPLSISTGDIAGTIGSRGYADTGFRFRTDGSGNLYRFVMNDGECLYHPHEGATWGFEVGYGCTMATMVPPDKNGICYTNYNFPGGVVDYRIYCSMYYDTPNGWIVSRFRDYGSSHMHSMTYSFNVPSPHNITYFSRSNANGNAYIRGYVI